MAISVTKVFDSVQTDHVANPITLVLSAPIPIGAKALLCNASTIDDAAGVAPGSAAWGGIITITDARGNTWVRDVFTPVDTTDTFTTVEIWRSDITGALQNGDVITVTGAARGLSMEMGILDCRGLAAGAPDKTAGSNYAGSNAVTTGTTATTTIADALIVGVFGIGSGVTTSGWFTPGGAFIEQLDRGDGGTVNRAVAITTQIVSATGTYVSTGTAIANVTGNGVIAAYSTGLAAQSTGIAALALGPILRPDTRTGHEIHLRARKAGPAEVGVLRVWLYESGALRSGPWDVGLNDNFTSSTIVLPDADAALIGSYANLELRLQGVTTSGPITPQLSFIELQTPGASVADPGQTGFPNFSYPGRAVSPAKFRPGAMMRSGKALFGISSPATPQSYFGVVSMPIVVNVTDAGVRTTLGSSSTPVVFSVSTAGTVSPAGTTVFGASSSTYTFTTTTAGTGTTTVFGSSSTPIVISRTTAGRSKYLSSSNTPINFTVTSIGTGGTAVATASYRALVGVGI